MIDAEESVVMTHDVGLHARPSVVLTKLAKSYAASIELATESEGVWVDAKSIVKVMAMKAPKDTTLHFRATGEGAQDAVDTLIRLVENDFVLED